MAERVLLVGMMGVGKTTTGRELAAQLGWAYCDSDDQVEAATGRTVPEILASDGEAAFRREETRALERAVGGENDAVVSVAGGAVLDPANRARIAQAGTVVWLRARLDTLAVRVGSGEGRPLLGDDPRAALERLYERRGPLYAELADVTVDVDDLAPAAVVQRVRAELGR